MRVRGPGTVLRLLLIAAAVAGLGAVLGSGLTRHSDQAADPALPVTQRRDDAAPALSGDTLDGHPFDLTALRGRVVVVNVMASWCGPCRDELPLLARAAKTWSAQGVRVVGLSMRDDPGQARRLLRDSKADFPVLADPDGTQAIAWGVRGVPETFVVDRTGRLRLHALGPVSDEWLQRELPPLLSS
jgi:cytochrome c biogenesis protein CcmG/thiol:disulfide interchange protein DsbE